MDNFLNRLNRNPYQPIDSASITRVDELGNGYDDWNNLIAPKFEAPQQTWGETALGVATAPARIATALAGSLSPYGADGWQVPPIVHEGVNALTAVGDAYNYGMTDDEINSRALGMAGFMMGGGGLAAKSPVSRAANLFPDQPRAMSADLFAEAVPAGERFGARTAADASKESSIPAIASALEQKGARPEPSALPQGRSDGVSDVLAEPVDYNAWLDRVQASVDDGAEGPFFGPANPEAVTGTALQDIARQSYQKEMDYNGWPNELTGDQPPHAAIASSLRDAAEATGRSLDIYGDERFPFKSAYGTLRTPAENTYKVRIADHANTTAYHGKPDFNIAPGAMTPEEFIDLLPAIYSNSDSRPALLASALEQKGARPEPSANALSSELSGTGFYPLSGGAETGTYLAFDDIPGNAPSPKQQQVRQMAAGHQGRMRSHPGQQAPEGLSSKMGGQELDSSGTPIGSFLDRSHYPRTGLNPIHEVHNWAKVRSMARKAINGEHVPGYLYDGLNGNGNLLAGTHRAAANELLGILGYGKRIKSANINDVLDEPEAYGLSARNADRLRQAAEDGDYRLIDEIWDQSRDTSLFSNSDSRPALLASALGQDDIPDWLLPFLPPQ
jgi:hypothetical protein